MIGYLGPEKNPKTEKLNWVSEGLPENGRQRACDVIRESIVMCAECEIVPGCLHVVFHSGNV